MTQTQPTKPQDKQRTCSHVRENGLKCRAVAMTGARFCFFHARAIQRRRILRDVLSSRISTFSHPDRRPDNIPWDEHTAILFQTLDLPLVEDASSIQVLLNSLIQAVGTHQLTERRASFMLRAIRTFIALRTPFDVERREPVHHPSLVAQQETDPLYYPFAGQFTTQDLVADNAADDEHDRDNESARPLVPPPAGRQPVARHGSGGNKGQEGL